MCPRNNLFQFWTSKKWGPSQADDVSCHQLICLPFVDVFDSSHFFSWIFLVCSVAQKSRAKNVHLFRISNSTGSKESTDIGQDSKDNSGSRS